MLVALNSSDHASADLLLLLASEEERISVAENPDEVPPPFRFTGDGLPALSGLIASGLVIGDSAATDDALFGTVQFFCKT